MCKEYINIQTREKIDLERVVTLAENSILKVKPELWCYWNFEMNSNLDIWKMTRGSDRKAWWVCDKCQENSRQVIHNRISGTGCPICAGKVAGKNSNLALIEPQLASEWHPTKNGDLTPFDVTFRSGKKVWWICSENHSYIGAIADRGSGKGCPYCANKKVLVGFNNLSHSHPHFDNLLLNKDDGLKYTYGSKKKVDFICNCGNNLKKPINEVVARGLSCPKCKDGVSFGEKVMYYLLSENNIDFQYDSRTSFSGKKRYDFILTEHNTIIEIQGEQHSKRRTGYFSNTGTLEEEIKNDILKKEMALSNGIENYYTIDVYDRNIEQMAENIAKSGLLNLINIHDIDWIDLCLKSQKSLVSQVCTYYENNEYSTGEVAEIFKLSIHTIIRYLKIGNTLGICRYHPNDKKSKSLSVKRISKKVVQFDKDGNFMKIYNSVSDASKELGIIGNGAISGCCKGTHKSVKGFIYKYYSEIGEIKKIDSYNRKDNKSVVQLSLDNELIKIHETITNAMNETGARNISKVCNGEYSQCKGFKWMYINQYEDFLKNQNKIS